MDTSLPDSLLEDSVGRVKKPRVHGVGRKGDYFSLKETEKVQTWIEMSSLTRYLIFLLRFRAEYDKLMKCLYR